MWRGKIWVLNVMGRYWEVRGKGGGTDVIEGHGDRMVEELLGESPAGSLG